MNKGYTPMGNHHVTSNFLVLDIQTRKCVAKNKIVAIVPLDPMFDDDDQDFIDDGYQSRIWVSDENAFLSRRSCAELWMELQ